MLTAVDPQNNIAACVVATGAAISRRHLKHEIERSVSEQVGFDAWRATE